MKFGSIILMENAYSALNAASDLLKDNQLVELRKLDGRIALSLYGCQTSDSSYVCEHSEWPYALVMTTKLSVSVYDIIEFENPTGNGWIMMNSSKIASFTTNLDAAFQLLPDNCTWIMSSDGSVKVNHGGHIIKQRLATPALSICAAGLLFHLRSP